MPVAFDDLIPATTGEKKSLSFDDLIPSNDAEFDAWKRRNAPSDSGEDYDLRAAFKAGVSPDASGHWTDKFKKPNHPTFSNESIYAKGDDALKAGHWDGDRFISPPAEIQAADEQQAMERKAAQTATVGDARNTVRDMLDTGTEGVARGLLGPASAFLSKEELQKPRVSPEVLKYAMIYPKVADMAAEAFPNSPAQYVKPVTDAMANTASGFTSAQNIGLLGLAPGSQTAQRLVAGTFLGQSIVGTPEQWEAFNEAKAVPDKIRIATEMGLSLALPSLALAHSRAGEVPKEVRQSPESVSAVESRQQSAETDLSFVPKTAPENTQSFPVAETVRPQESPVQVRPAQPEITTPIVEPSTKETVRLYHGATKGIGQAGRDFTTDLQYAQGYADKAVGGGEVWYVDVPKGTLKTHDEYGQPMTRVIVPDEIADKAQLLKAPSVQEAPIASTQGELPPKAKQEDLGNSEVQGAKDATGQTKPFVPTTEWQEIPDGIVLPNGGEYRFDQKSGKNFARWKAEDLPAPIRGSQQYAETAPETIAPSRSAGQPDESPQESAPTGPPSETTPTSTKNATTDLERESRGIAPAVEAETSKVGIAHEYGEERFPDEIDRGEGTTVEAQVERGRELLRRGTDPGQIIRRVEKTGRVSGDDMAVLRAQLETFQHAADTAAEASRTNPGDPVLKRASEQAMQNELVWRKTIKPAATAFHEIGMTLQGQAEVNYGTLEGLRRSAFDIHGKDVNPAQAATLREVATRVRRETQLATESLQRATMQIESTLGRKRPARSVEQLRNDLANRLRELTPC